MATEAGRRQALLFGGIALAGLVAGAIFGRSPLPDTGPVEADWSLPDAAALARLDPEDVQVLSSARLWRGAPEPVGTEGVRESQWKLLGVVSEGGGTALVGTGARMTDVKRMQAGETLPDGSTLVSVHADRIVTRQDDCRRTIRLFQGAGAARAPKCDTPAPTTDKRPG